MMVQRALLAQLMSLECYMQRQWAKEDCVA